MSPTLYRLIVRIRELEEDPRMTKTGIKSAVFADHSIDWRRLREEHARRRPTTLGGLQLVRSANWKADLVTSLLQRRFPHGGARRRRAGLALASGVTSSPAVVPSDPPPPPIVPCDSPPVSAVGRAICMVVDALPARDQMFIQAHLSRRLGRCADGVPVGPVCSPPRPTSVQDPDQLAALLQRRHIEHWHGMRCFTSRVLRHLQAEQQEQQPSMGAWAEAVEAWWHAKGCYMSHFRHRTGNRLTAMVGLVYTNLPEDHPLVAEVAAFCRDQCPTMDGRATTATTEGVVEQRLTEATPAEPAVQHQPQRPGGDPAATWRVFVQRFPVLSLYAPLWDSERAVQMSPTSPLLVDPHVAALARELYPPTATHLTPMEGLQEAATLMHGFGAHAPAVLEAIRLGSRASHDPT